MMIGGFTTSAMDPPARAGWYKRFFAAFMASTSAAYEPMVADRKRALLSNLSGEVLEIGPGTGPNLPFYSKTVHLIGVEPNPYMDSYLEKAAARHERPIEIWRGTAERLPAGDNTVDAVVSTLVLCSVRNLDGVLKEIRRVLKPGGRLVFVEHVAAPRGTWLRRLQRVVRPIWRICGDGCHPDRETWTAIEQAGFKQVSIEHFRVPIGVAAPHIAGVAVEGSD